jgi:competence protein ComFC
VLKSFKNFLSDCLFPTFCCSCQKIGPYVCPQCYEQLTFFPLPLKLQLEENFLDEVIVATEYKKPITSLIYSMKYTSVRGICEYLGEFLHYTTNFPNPDVVTSVPLHKKRQQQRGFNQSEEIAKSFSQFSKIPYLPLLQRSRDTPNQASLTQKEERLKNLEAAFTFQLPKNSQLPQSVLIIDDVITTGTTLNECAKVLKGKGVTKVVGLTVAHGS